MATTFTIKSLSFKANLKYTDKNLVCGNLCFDGLIPDVDAKFVINQISGSTLVQIQCCHNGKYLKRKDDGWLSPDVDANQGDKFQLITVEDGKQVFLHGQLKTYAFARRADKPNDQTIGFFVGEDTKPTEQSKMQITNFPVSVAETTSEVRENK